MGNKDRNSNNKKRQRIQSVCARALDNIINYCILLFGICLFLLGMYGLYDNIMLFQNASSDKVAGIKAAYEDTENATLPEDNIAWISIRNTTIDYPVMQGKDNLSYLNMDPYGNYSLSGSIFVDYRNEPDFSNHYNLIYGHHMAAGAMFGALDKYQKKGYMETHQDGQITLKDGTVMPFRVFAVLYTDATDVILFSMEQNMKEIEQHIRELAIYYDADADDTSADMVVLSTCRYPDTTERTLVIGRFC